MVSNADQGAKDSIARSDAHLRTIKHPVCARCAHLEHEDIPDVASTAHAVCDGLCQAGGVRKAHVDALPSKRVHGVRGVAY